MTIDEAKTHLADLKKSDMLQFDPELRNACQLGIEALKLYKELRTQGWRNSFPLLPGETEE